MQRNRRRTVIFVLIFLTGIVAFACTYRVMAGGLSERVVPLAGY